MIEHVHTYPDGRQHKITFTSHRDNGEYLRDSFLHALEDINTMGLETALQKWHDKEAAERKELGLEVKDRY
jgi:hypothetical protein